MPTAVLLEKIRPERAYGFARIQIRDGEGAVRPEDRAQGGASGVRRSKSTPAAPTPSSPASCLPFPLASLKIVPETVTRCRMPRRWAELTLSG